MSDRLNHYIGQRVIIKHFTTSRAHYLALHHIQWHQMMLLATGLEKPVISGMSDVLWWVPRMLHLYTLKDQCPDEKNSSYIVVLVFFTVSYNLNGPMFCIWIT